VHFDRKRNTGGHGSAAPWPGPRWSTRTPLARTTAVSRRATGRSSRIRSGRPHSIHSRRPNARRSASGVESQECPASARGDQRVDFRPRSRPAEFSGRSLTDRGSCSRLLLVWTNRRRHRQGRQGQQAEGLTEAAVAALSAPSARTVVKPSGICQSFANRRSMPEQHPPVASHE